MCFLKDHFAPRRFNEQPRTKADQQNSLAFFNSDWGLKDVSPNYNEVAFNPFALDLGAEVIRNTGPKPAEPQTIAFNDDIYQSATKSTKPSNDGYMAASLTSSGDVFANVFSSGTQDGLVKSYGSSSLSDNTSRSAVNQDSYQFSDKGNLIQVSTDRAQHKEISHEEKHIDWQKDASTAYTKSVESNQPMVMVFEEQGPWTDKVNAELEKPEIQQYASEAVFVKAVPSKDLVAKNIATALGVEHLPTVSVLDPDPEMISERGRIQGFEAASVLGADLGRFIRNYVRPPQKKIADVTTV